MEALPAGGGADRLRTDPNAGGEPGIPAAVLWRLRASEPVRRRSGHKPRCGGTAAQARRGRLVTAAPFLFPPRGGGARSFAWRLKLLAAIYSQRCIVVQSVMTILQLRNRRRTRCMSRNPMLRLLMLSFIPDTRPLFAAEFSLLGAWVWPGGGGCLSPALKLGPTSPAPRVRWSIRGDPPTLVRRILTSSTSRRRQKRALHPAAACSVGALAVLRLPPWRRRA